MIDEKGRYAIIPMEEYNELKKCFEDTKQYISGEVATGQFEVYRQELEFERKRYDEMQKQNRSNEGQIEELSRKLILKEKVIEDDLKTLNKLRNNFLFLILFGRYTS